MVAINLGSSSTTSSSTSIALSPPAPSSKSVLLIAVSVSGTTASVTGITGGSASYVQVASGAASNKRLEMWVGYNYGDSFPGSITIYTTSGSVYKSLAARTVTLSGDASSMAVASSASAATGTSTAAMVPSLAPSTGDMMFVALSRDPLADSTARTSTGNVYVGNISEDISSSKGVETMWCLATSATSSAASWTLAGSASDWVTAQFIWSPGAEPSAVTGAVVKGLDTATADNASSY